MNAKPRRLAWLALGWMLAALGTGSVAAAECSHWVRFPDCPMAVYDTDTPAAWASSNLTSVPLNAGGNAVVDTNQAGVKRYPYSSANPDEPTYALAYSSFGQPVSGDQPGLLRVTTLPPTDVLSVGTNAGATLHGTVQPSGLEATAWFEWGVGRNFDHASDPVSLGSVWDTFTVSNLISDLPAGVVCGYRLVASNALVTVRGADQLFSSVAIVLSAPDPLTNECHVAFTNLRVVVTGPPLAVAGANYHSLALKADGTAAAWGTGFYGQTNIPAGATNLVAIAAKQAYNLALKTDGTAVGWGANDNGSTNVPAEATNLVAIAAGDLHSLALKADGTVIGWGYNYSGQATGVPNYVSPHLSTGVVMVAGQTLTNAVAIAAGGAHSLALTTDGRVVGWGYTNTGQLAIPAGLKDVVAIAAGESHSLALQADGTVVGWGNNIDGQAAIPANATNVVAIAAGWSHSLALRANGTAIGWGKNDYGQTTIPANATNVVAIAAGANHCLAIRADGAVVGWGNNGFQQVTVPGGLTTLSLPIALTGSVDTNTPGIYSLTCTVTNAWGAAATAMRTVVVTDTRRPNLVLLGANPLGQPAGFPFVDPGATAIDACAGDLTAGIVLTNNVNPAVAGTYTNTYVVTDASGNSAQTNRVINIVDQPPVVSTLPATDIALTSATLRSQVNPNGLETGVWFEWGTTTNYGSATPAGSAGCGLAAVPANMPLTGLDPGLVYHYRAVASNSLATVIGLDQSFTAGYLAVTNLADQGDGSLRQALADAGANCTITLLATGRVALTSGQLAIADNVTLLGPGATNLTISGNGLSRVFYVNAGVNVSCSGLTISDGHAADGQSAGAAGAPGGGIYNLGDLALTSCIIRSNSAGNGATGSSGIFGTGGSGGNGGSGGGVFNGSASDLIVVDCAIYQNNAGRGGDGGYGGIGSAGGKGGNGGSGGGIYNDGHVSAGNSTLHTNRTGQGGAGGMGGSGGLFGPNGGPGGNGGDGGSGGAILTAAGDITLWNCTLSDSFAAPGGAGGAGGFPGSGGSWGAPGIAGAAGAGGGIRTGGGISLLNNTLVAGNSAITGTDVSGAFTSSGHNLISRSDGSTGLTNGIQDDLVGTLASPLNPLLDSLAFNDGPTPTRALLSGSPAIDAGDDWAGAGTDQRGVVRPQDGDGNGSALYDIGAYEVPECGADVTRPVITLNGPNLMSTNPGVPFVDPGATAVDLCSGDLTASIVSNLTVNPYSPGTYTNRFVVTDDSGNFATTNRVVIVLPPAAPVLAGCSMPAAAQVRVQGYGVAGLAYTLQSSTNLVEWINHTNVVAGPGGVIEWLGEMDPGTPVWFYRLRWP